MRTSNPLILVQHRYPDDVLVCERTGHPAEIFMQNPRGSLIPTTRANFAYLRELMNKHATHIGNEETLQEVSFDIGMETYREQIAKGRPAWGSRYNSFAQNEMLRYGIRTIVWSPRPIPDVAAVFAELHLPFPEHHSRLKDFPINGMDVFAAIDEPAWSNFWHGQPGRSHRLQNFWAGPARAFFVMELSQPQTINPEIEQYETTREVQTWPDILSRETWERLASLSSYYCWSSQSEERSEFNPNGPHVQAHR